jgi:hypothetical protein
LFVYLKSNMRSITSVHEELLQRLEKLNKQYTDFKKAIIEERVAKCGQSRNTIMFID